MVLLAHGHYTVDILIAYYVTTRLFWTYHTLANNSLLLKVSIIKKSRSFLGLDFGLIKCITFSIFEATLMS